MEYYKTVLKKYAVFDGRARRMEYWMFVLFSAIVSIVLSIVDAMLSLNAPGGFGLLSGLYSVAVLIPSIAVAVRRLHDTNRSGWWIFIGIIPVLGWVALIVFMFLDSTPGDNKYGPNPKEVPAIGVPSAPAAV